MRGRFGFEYLDGKTRLTQPLVREGNHLAEKPWLETMHLLVDRFTEIKRKHGADAIGGLITARCTNEEVYLFQKLMRTAFGSNHLDSSARYGHLNFVHASKRAVGLGRTPNDWEDLTRAKAIFLIGSNITETNPLTAVRIKEAIRVYKAQVVTLDSAITNMAKLASHPLLIKPGSEGLVLDGLVKATIDQDLVDEEATKKHPKAFEALKSALAGLSFEQLAVHTGVSVDAFKELAAIFAESPRSIILCAEGIVRRRNGYHNVLKLIDLAWITGKLGRPGCGVNTVTEEPNEQGAVDMGAAPEFLPGQARFDDPAARERFAKAWEVSLPPVVGTGTHLVDILKRCKHGQIKALYVVGENPLATLPASMEVRAALERLELLVVQDPFLTETGRQAHFVLPACTYAEKDGTFTNLEGRVLRVRQALDPIGESLPDWHIMTALANAMGCQWGYQSSNDIQAEIMKLLPGYYNLGQPRKVTPVPDEYLANGYAAEVKARYETAANPGVGTRPFALLMGQLLMHSGKMSTESPGLIKIAPNTGKLRMNTHDMERLGLRDGTKVRLTSERGSLQLGVQSDQFIAPGTCFFPEHFNEPPVKDLMTVSVDAVTGVPSFKQTWVNIERA